MDSIKGKLTSESVDLVSEKIGEFLDASGCERKTALKIKLHMEDLLLDIRDRFDSGREYTLETGSRFRKPYISFFYEGERFNPVEHFSRGNTMQIAEGKKR